MSHQFDLEQQILGAWRVTEDVKLILDTLQNRNMTQDEIANLLLGVVSLYELKFDQLFRTFEAHLSDYYHNVRLAETVTDPAVDSTTAD